MRALWQLLPGVWNSLRCIGKADGLGRRLLVGALGLLYACLAPGLLIGTVAFITYVAFARAEADFTLFEWWRIPALLIGLLLIRLVIRQVLTACDFVADVANYVGNPAHRKEAEDRLIALLRELGERYPAAKIVLVGHSLGSVLVSQGVLRLNDGEAITQRLLLVTMGSPLRIMAWFFPDHIRSPIGLLHQYVDRRLVMAWANLWRDADFIGRGLGQEVIAEARSGFAETSLGDGTHPDYWSDPRCWQAIVQFLDAAGGGAQQDLASTWAERMTEGEEAELQRRASLAVKFALGITPLAATALFYGLEWIRNHAWLAAMSPRSRWLVLALTGVSVVLFTVYYYFTSRRVGGDGASRRTMLARYRLYWTAGMACAQPAALAAFAAGFLLWRFYPG